MCSNKIFIMKKKYVKNIKKVITLVIVIFFVLLSYAGSKGKDGFLVKKNIKSDAITKITQKEASPKEIKPDIISATFSISDDKKFSKYIPILMFHYIKDVPSDSSDQLGYRLSFSPKKFEEFLVYFKENDIKTLTFWDLKDIIENKKEMPKKAVMLTFDDGYIDHYTNAYPLLKKYNMKGVFYIISDKPNTNSDYMNWEQIKEMADSGQEIGSHTISHPNLFILTNDQIKEQLGVSKKTIEEKIGRSVISLCYPSGRYDSRVIKIAKQYYLFARTTEQGYYFSMKKRYQIPTLRIFPTTGIDSLKALF